MLQAYNSLGEFSTHPLNRYLFAILVFLLILLPIHKSLLLDDFIFIMLTVIVAWAWISWSRFLEKKQK